VFNKDVYKEFVEEFGNEFSYAEVDEMAGSTDDFFGALTRERIGSGHGVAYYKRMGLPAQGAEWYAHMSENYFVGNKFFEWRFPEYYKLTLEFMEKVVNNDL